MSGLKTHETFELLEHLRADAFDAIHVLKARVRSTLDQAGGKFRSNTRQRLELRRTCGIQVDALAGCGASSAATDF